jgi:ribosomal protein L32
MSVDRIDLYLQQNIALRYSNTAEEMAQVTKVDQLRAIAQAEQDKQTEADPNNLDYWRRAYLGTLNALDKDTGKESTKKVRQIRKALFEIIEAQVDNSIPMPKMTPRRKIDMNMTDITEEYLKFESDRMITEAENDRSERATRIDGTSWYKVCWDILDNSYDRSGDIRVDVKLVDQVIPEPGTRNYKLMNYIFEIETVSLSRIYDMYGRLINVQKDGLNTCDVVTLYYKNKDGIIARFMYAKHSLQVITHEEDWQMRKLRKCQHCGEVNAIGDVCKNCGHTHFKYESATEEVLEEDIFTVRNPYEEGSSQDPNDTFRGELFARAGETIPFYRLTQLPFVPRPNISTINKVYGISECMIGLDMQDNINKVLTKATEVVLKSGVVVTRPDKIKINDNDQTYKQLGVRTKDEAAMVDVKEISGNVQQHMAMAQLQYESLRSSGRITEAYQGKIDRTATSGKAKEISAMQTAGMQQSTVIMKEQAMAHVYELVFKYLLAFSDETRKFVKVLPGGEEEEMLWNKYMFLRKDKLGKFYYMDDFAWGTDPAATLSQNRVAMWQETQSQFIQGTLGNPADPRVQMLYWNMMKMHGYPVAKLALSGIMEISEQLPIELQQAIMQNPELLQMAQNLVNEMQSQGQGSGGARPNSGPAGNGATHGANVERTNERNRAAAGPANPLAMGGGM